MDQESVRGLGEPVPIKLFAEQNLKWFIFGERHIDWADKILIFIFIIRNIYSRVRISYTLACCYGFFTHWPVATQLISLHAQWKTPNIVGVPEMARGVLICIKCPVKAKLTVLSDLVFSAMLQWAVHVLYEMMMTSGMRQRSGRYWMMPSSALSSKPTMFSKPSVLRIYSRWVSLWSCCAFSPVLPSAWNGLPLYLCILVIVTQNLPCCFRFLVL